MKRFNIAGPCDPQFHYMIPPAPRLPEVPHLVREGAYFAIHAPRQTGKTTTLRALAEAITAEGTYAALYASCEAARVRQEDLAALQDALLHTLRTRAERQLPDDCQPPPTWPPAHERFMLSAALAAWCQRAARPLVLFLDEVDVLTGDALITVLSQLRDSYADRPRYAPWSVALCGLRDVRDYKAAAGGDPEHLGSSSPFNIKTSSLRLHDFTRDEVEALYAQHTADGGPRYDPDAIDRVVHLTGGQPWLVNALGRDLAEHHPDADAIGAAQVEAAAGRLIRARATHIDSLLARLREPRVRRIIEPLIAGTTAVSPTYREDFEYTRDLGLVVADPELRVTNPIYREVIARELAIAVEQERLPGPRRYVHPDGRLDLRALLEAFGAWWVQHGENVAAKLDDHEVAPQLVLMAFLQRVVNGGGFVDREYGIGKGAIDLMVRWPLPDGSWQREGLELKVWRDKRPDPLEAGLSQLDGYLARMGLPSGALVIFDQRTAREAITTRVRVESARSPEGREVLVLRA
ncbi:MAG: AAA-like domain-containing protein [Myxococcales bacterium]|nr:AAA-like domain-containing protein [Myxococcales bacterium]